jgi:hypothetical protein
VAYTTEETMVKSAIRPAAARRQVRKALVALLAVGVLLALSTGPAGAATTFKVNRTGDAADRDLANSRCDTSTKKGNQCTMRAAIEEANDTAGADTIEFDIGSGTSVRTISPASALPVIREAVTVDGYTQKGAKENTLEEGTSAVLKVKLSGASTGGFVTGLRIEAADTTIRGLVINDFHVGVNMVGFDTTRNTVEGNFVGTNPAGDAALGNALIGVSISSGVPGNTVGGTEPAQRNLISGNEGDGIVVAGPDNKVQGNLVGTTASGTGDLGNSGDGVHVSNSDNTVGDTEPGAANTIAFNGGSGVLVDIPTARGNSVLSNSIFSNDGLGIDLNNDGVTNNDADDPDTGENNFQNFPALDSAIRNSTTGFTAITGTLNSNPDEDFLIQCFLADGPTDASGHGEGEVLLDTTSSSTDSSGDATFQCDTREAGLGQEVTATATNVATGDTSEFSANEEVIGTVSLP